MTRYELLFPSDYLRAAEFVVHGPQTMTIQEVLQEELQLVGGRKETKPIVRFEGTKKKLVLNKTNAKAIAKIVGSAETRDWHGRQVELFAEKTRFGREEVDGIRVRRPTGGQIGRGSRR